MQYFWPNKLGEKIYIYIYIYYALLGRTKGRGNQGGREGETERGSKLKWDEMEEKGWERGMGIVMKPADHVIPFSTKTPPLTLRTKLLLWKAQNFKLLDKQVLDKQM